MRARRRKRKARPPRWGPVAYSFGSTRVAVLWRPGATILSHTLLGLPLGEVGPPECIDTRELALTRNPQTGELVLDRNRHPSWSAFHDGIRFVHFEPERPRLHVMGSIIHMH